MTTASIAANPFALLMNPEAVLAAVAGSERLARLKSRICRPLDKAQGPAVDGEPAEAPETEPGVTVEIVDSRFN